MDIELFILDMKHLPEMCPMFNPEVKHIFLERTKQDGRLRPNWMLKL